MFSIRPCQLSALVTVPSREQPRPWDSFCRQTPHSEPELGRGAWPAVEKPLLVLHECTQAPFQAAQASGSHHTSWQQTPCLSGGRLPPLPNRQPPRRTAQSGPHRGSEDQPPPPSPPAKQGPEVPGVWGQPSPVQASQRRPLGAKAPLTHLVELIVGQEGLLVGSCRGRRAEGHFSTIICPTPANQPPPSKQPAPPTVCH